MVLETVTLRIYVPLADDGLARTTVSIEALHAMVYDVTRPLGSGLFLGPTLSHVSERWWLTVSGTPQVASTRKIGAGPGPVALSLGALERFRWALVFGLKLP